uniref:Uncharacterized protein n=1 Tax=Setaria italica TaxID=4555 RepID=K3XTF6_SETIT
MTSTIPFLTSSPVSILHRPGLCHYKVFTDSFASEASSSFRHGPWPLLQL